jgi:hypothetical protein
MYYNFVPIHKTLRVTPAMGLACLIGFGRLLPSPSWLKMPKPTPAREGLTRSHGSDPVQQIEIGIYILNDH